MIAVVAAGVSVKEQDIDSLLLHSLPNLPEPPVVLFFGKPRMVLG
jgi:hypothetical protein